MQLEEIKTLLPGSKVFGSYPTLPKYLATDSRNPGLSKEYLFVALKGPRNDGHQFIKQVYDSGLGWFLVEEYKSMYSKRYPEACFIKVGNTIAALQSLAAWRRNQFSGKVMAITGSNGKTVVKEWLSFLLEPHFALCKSPASYNSQIGVPLSVWNLSDQHELGIFEAGLSQPGEMIKLEAILQPEYGIITNLGSAHDLGFKDRKQKLKEKLRLFKRSKHLIYRYEGHYSGLNIAEEYKGSAQLHAWEIQNRKSTGQGLDLSLYFRGKAYSLLLPFAHDAAVENACHAFCMALLLGLPPQAANKGLNQLRPIGMRLSMVKGQHQLTLIDDTYNNDLQGIAALLEFSEQQQIPKTRHLVLSELREGRDEHYQELEKLLNRYSIDQVYALGPGMKKVNRLNSARIDHFENRAALEAYFGTHPPRNVLLLVKGSRDFALEKLVESLKEQSHRTVLEVNLEALRHNLNVYKGMLASGTGLMVMVKAFAYGGGVAEIGRLLQYEKVDYLAVAFADEGRQLREAGVKLPIMVMNPPPESFDVLIRYQLEPEIFSFRQWKSWVEFMNFQVPESSPAIHLKLDTGMHRLGFSLEELPALMEEVKHHSKLRIASVFSHLSASDDPGDQAYSLQQAGLFEEMLQMLGPVIQKGTKIHLANSAAIVRFPKLHYDMVRLGLGLYGMDPAVGLADSVQGRLQSVAVLKSYISQLKEVRAGEGVGYGREDILKEPKQVATVPIGYADGYHRAFSKGKGWMYIQGQKAPVLGKVCMDMCMIDVSHIQGIEEGEEVLVYADAHHVQDLAHAIHTIPYELISTISQRVPREFVR